ncbi:MAG: hypothetical protein Q8L60_08620 [Gammaproteobacteria bacterium]|nr:hypothetical protein [Gammaproteobacteria bacterium]MDP2140235.1 hypothetical protein [Gammaproteobacteria bacterium]MDP2348110.1 hypothetical protein [Gammaproteobacteria bacterium]
MMMNLYRLTPQLRRALPLVVALVFAGCASSGTDQNVPDQSTVIEAQRIADQAAAARAVEERARITAAAAERERQAALARQQEAERRAQAEAAAQAEREVVARAQAAEQRQRQQEAAQQARIVALETEIAASRSRAGGVTAANAKLEEAIATAEQLLDVLTAEQLKYGNTNAAGEPVDPLQKDLIADLEARKDNLKREAQALTQQ